MEDVYVQSLESDFAHEMLSTLASNRSLVAAVLDNGQTLQLPHLKSYLRHIINAPELTDPQAMWDRLYQRFVDNALSVKTRGFTFGTPTAAVGNVGNGTILRLNKDENNFDIENQFPDAKTATCTQDQTSGAEKHEEIFEFRGQSPGRDSLQIVGSGKIKSIKALSARDSLLLNPSFSSFSGTIAAPTDITNWTSSVTVNGTNYSLDQTNFYRGFPGDTTPTALNFKVTANLTQKLSLRGTQLNPKIPHFLQLAFNRAVGAGSGTLVVRMGAVSTTTAIAAQVGWNVVRVPTTTGNNNWYKQFNEQDIDIAIEWTRTAGDLLIDDVIFAPFTDFDNSWYAIIANAATVTPFLRNDKFTWTDTATESILQYWFWRSFGRYLPSVAVAETFTDPTG